jgi:hypothetical protein
MAFPSSAKLFLFTPGKISATSDFLILQQECHINFAAGSGVILLKIILIFIFPPDADES